MSEGYYTISNFLSTYAISRTKTYEQIKRGKLRLTKIDRASRISKADAEAWAATLPTIGGDAR